MFELDVLLPEPPSGEDALASILERCRNAPTAYEHWAPAVETAGVSSPATLLVPLSTGLQLTFIDGYPPTPETEANLDQIVKAVEEMGAKHGFPLFIKTSFTSNKHYWQETCCLPNADRATIIKHMGEILFSQGFSPYPFAASLLIREMLKTEPAFHAFGSMPVTQEFRVFAGNGTVEGYQPYWPKESIKDPSAPDWEQKLAVINSINDQDLRQLTKMAGDITRHLDGEWSVDFLKDRDGKWWLIDMAEAKLSYVNKLEYKSLKVDTDLAPGL